MTNEPYFHQQMSSNSHSLSNTSLTYTVKYTEQYESVKAVNFLKGAFQITTLEVIMAQEKNQRSRSEFSNQVISTSTMRTPSES